VTPGRGWDVVPDPAYQLAGRATAQSPPDPAAVYRLVAEWVQSIYPTARNLRIVGDVPDESGSSTTFRFPVPTRVELDPDVLDAAIVGVLSGLKAGHRLSGAALAIQIDEDLDHTGGTFKRAVRRLRAAGRIDSDRAGYWLIS
jgi:hypothetical protein